MRNIIVVCVLVASVTIMVEAENTSPAAGLCAGQPCQHGTCVVADNGTYWWCDCDDGYYGDLCEQAETTTPHTSSTPNGELRCEDGPNVEETDPGDYHVRDCVNQGILKTYSCQGPCPPGQTCVGVPNGDEVINMTPVGNGRNCPDYINPIIKECECVDQVPATPRIRRALMCKRVKRRYPKSSFARTIGGKRCVNVESFRRDYCQGSCPVQGEKCTGTYVNEIIVLDCGGGTRVTRAVMRAITCCCK